ncbi:MAG TPA: crossover junction endodeoxyribonuclease RuvC [bacterium]|nr:crossover junction endodeoxyribonuclease RuvC [bacterium]HOL46860.1 crossover junction endodeoxyribonuclease RuvC [bacterium]HPQ18791.1 crossover junction endodeoxyribonuclease RuvC [bacterium]
MRVIGIDPGLERTGYGIIEEINNNLKVLDYGLIKTSANKRFEERLLYLHNELEEKLKVFRPDVSVIEDLFFCKNIKTAFIVGQARGVVLLTCANYGLKYEHFTPLQVKQAVVGYGNADKNQVQQMIKILLNLKEIPKPDDVADALALAITYLNSKKFKEQINDSNAEW